MMVVAKVANSAASTVARKAEWLDTLMGSILAVVSVACSVVSSVVCLGSCLVGMKAVLKAPQLVDWMGKG